MVSEPLHDADGIFRRACTLNRTPRPDPQDRSYSTWAPFSDADGNGWMLEEVKMRLPGRAQFNRVVAVSRPNSIGGRDSTQHE